MSHLEGNLQETCLDSNTRLEIITRLWQDISNESSLGVDSRPYFHYYESQRSHALHDQGNHILMRTHEDIIKAAEKLEAGSTRDEIKQDLKHLFKSKGRKDEDKILNNSVDLAARLYLMINVGGDKSTVTRDGN